jgi:hypothetical protein
MPVASDAPPASAASATGRLVATAPNVAASSATTHIITNDTDRAPFVVGAAAVGRIVVLCAVALSVLVDGAAGVLDTSALMPVPAPVSTFATGSPGLVAGVCGVTD